jgi:hypothetical protein
LAAYQAVLARAPLSAETVRTYTSKVTQSRFALDPEKSARWWADVLNTQVHLDVGDSVYAWFDPDGVEYGFHPAEDDRNPRGAARSSTGPWTTFTPPENTS